jgi:hypothetical protein
MENIQIIHLLWREHQWSDDIYKKFNSSEDYGIYQIYGDHPVYGENLLLYIGKAQDQTYSMRLTQHFNGGFITESHIPKFTRLHLSYFCKTDGVNNDNWGEYIGLVEKILINAHFPAYNSQEIKGVMDKEQFKKELLIMNWEERGKLLPELSSLRYSYHFWDDKRIDFDHILKDK